MSEEELTEKLEKRYGIIFPKGYIHFALTFNELVEASAELKIRQILALSRL